MKMFTWIFARNGLTSLRSGSSSAFFDAIRLFNVLIKAVISSKLLPFNSSCSIFIVDNSSNRSCVEKYPSIPCFRSSVP